MKKIASLTLLTALVLSLSWTPSMAQNATGVKYYKGTFDDFLREARRDHKPILIEFWAGWCAPCKKMDTETYQDAQLSTYVNHNYLTYRMDIESIDGLAIVEKYGIEVFPTLLVADYKGNEISQLKGFYSPKYLEEVLANLNRKHNLLMLNSTDPLVINK